MVLEVYQNQRRLVFLQRRLNLQLQEWLAISQHPQGEESTAQSAILEVSNNGSSKRSKITEKGAGR